MHISSLLHLHVTQKALQLVAAVAQVANFFAKASSFVTQEARDQGRTYLTDHFA